jgi:rod shape determining protein RodA
MKRSGNVWSNLDKLTLGLYLLIVFFGLLVVYAVQFEPGTSHFFDFGSIHGRQMMWIGISLVMGFTLLLFDTEFFTGFTWIIYGAVILLLIVVMLIGAEVNGARSWLQFGSVKIQPAEFAKYATALALAKMISAGGRDLRNLRDQIYCLAVIGLPAGLIILQGDPGSALVFAAFLIVLYREGFPIALVAIGIYTAALFLSTLSFQLGWLHGFLAATAIIVALLGTQKQFRKHQTQSIYLFLLYGIGLTVLIVTALLSRSLLITIPIALALFAGLVFATAFLRQERSLVLGTAGAFIISLFFSVFFVDFVFNDILEPHHQVRIQSLLGQKVTSDADYNVVQSKIAIASGGLTGKGYLEGTFTRFDHVPEQETDFIFCTVGEEFGFLGSLLFLLAYLSLLIRMVFLAERQRSRFSRCFAYGVAGLFFLQITINIGMTIGLAPVIGIPLPFISYGGSSVLAFSLLVFTMLRLDADRLLVLR